VVAVVGVVLLGQTGAAHGQLDAVANGLQALGAAAGRRRAAGPDRGLGAKVLRPGLRLRRSGALGIDLELADRDEVGVAAGLAKDADGGAADRRELHVVGLVGGAVVGVGVGRR